MLPTKRTGLRRALGLLAHHIASRTGYASHKARTSNQPRILMYHAVSQDLLTPRTFDAQLTVLRRLLDIVSLGELCNRHARHELRGNEVVLTFDDGVQNHLNVVYPILRRHNAPATFFVCPGLATSGQWPWTWEMRARLESLDTPDLMRLAKEFFLGPADVERVLEWVEQLGPVARREAEEKVRRATREFKPTAQQIDRFAPLSWSDLRQLDRDLITIGSHTIGHPMLNCLDLEDAREEIVGSRSQLEEQLDRQVDLFCYPNGATSEVAVDLVRQTYRAAVTTVPGFVSPRGPLHLLPRIGAAERMVTFEWRLHRT